MCLALALWPLLSLAAPPPIQRVELGPQREWRVNGQPFLPILIWLQNPENLAKAAAAGCNTAAGYWPQAGGTKDVVEYQQLLTTAGLYGVLPEHAGLVGHPGLLAYLHDDEPDLTHPVSDAKVEPGPGLRANNGAPLWKILDGVTSSWSVLDPLAGAQVTCRFAQPVTVARFGLHPTVSPGLAVAKTIKLYGDGRELASATLEARRGRQEVPLPAPATFRELRLEIVDTTPGEQVWGSLGELEGLDAGGNNVLASPPRQVAQATPAETAAIYQRLRAADPSRPVCMTLTAGFMPQFRRLPEEVAAVDYPQYVQATDVVGFDIYPLYGWARPDWIDRVLTGARDLTALAAGRPTYAWIETSNGSQWVKDSDANRVTGRHIKAEVWMSLCGGCTAVGYFTHVWKPAYNQFGVPPDNLIALQAINAQLTTLAPAILAAACPTPPTIQIAGDLPAAVIGRVHDGSTWLFAVNADPKDRGGLATITVPGLPAGRPIEVIDEARTLTSGPGTLQDEYGPLAVHLYRIRDWVPVH
ncbi:MAG: hypothetical protein IT204_20420 [Fimbriimonadaceae bacterium]|nr:hypothetical protein [Fimbriimonadaceae bacterium]